MHLLPTNLGPLVAVADKRGPNGRFALNSVHLTLNPDNTFEAVTTDTKALLRVSGPCTGPADQYPDLPGLKTAPNGESKGLIPSEAWDKAFKSAAKVTKRRGVTSELKCAAVVLGKELATFGATDLESFPIEQTRYVEGRYPPYKDILDQSSKDPKARVWVDPYMMSNVLEALAKTACTDEDCSVEIVFRGLNQPLLMRAGNNASGVKGEAILMPLAIEKGNKRHPELSEIERLELRVRELEEELGERQAEVRRLMHEADELKNEVVRAEIPLAAENTRLRVALAEKS